MVHDKPWHGPCTSNLRVKVALPDESLPMPYNKRPREDAGYDLVTIEDRWLLPLIPRKVPLNARIEVPRGFFGRVTSRSGMSAKGIFTIPGTIDSGYTGIIQAISVNLYPWPRKVKKGTRIAQIIFIPFLGVDFIKVENLGETDRGNKGFGSSGMATNL